MSKHHNLTLRLPIMFFLLSMLLIGFSYAVWTPVPYFHNWQNFTVNSWNASYYFQNPSNALVNVIYHYSNTSWALINTKIPEGNSSTQTQAILWDVVGYNVNGVSQGTIPAILVRDTTSSQWILVPRFTNQSNQYSFFTVYWNFTQNSITGINTTNFFPMFIPAKLPIPQISYGLIGTSLNEYGFNYGLAVNAISFNQTNYTIGSSTAYTISLNGRTGFPVSFGSGILVYPSFTNTIMLRSHNQNISFYPDGFNKVFTNYSNLGNNVLTTKSIGLISTTQVNSIMTNPYIDNLTGLGQLSLFYLFNVQPNGQDKMITDGEYLKFPKLFNSTTSVNTQGGQYLNSGSSLTAYINGFNTYNNGVMLFPVFTYNYSNTISGTNNAVQPFPNVQCAFLGCMNDRFGVYNITYFYNTKYNASNFCLYNTNCTGFNQQPNVPRLPTAFAKIRVPFVPSMTSCSNLILEAYNGSQDQGAVNFYVLNKTTTIQGSICNMLIQKQSQTGFVIHSLYVYYNNTFNFTYANSNNTVITKFNVNSIKGANKTLNYSLALSNFTTLLMHTDPIPNGQAVYWRTFPSGMGGIQQLWYGSGLSTNPIGETFNFYYPDGAMGGTTFKQIYNSTTTNGISVFDTNGFKNNFVLSEVNGTFGVRLNYLSDGGFVYQTTGLQGCIISNVVQIPRAVSYNSITGFCTGGHTPMLQLNVTTSGKYVGNVIITAAPSTPSVLYTAIQTANNFSLSNLCQGINCIPQTALPNSTTSPSQNNGVDFKTSNAISNGILNNYAGNIVLWGSVNVPAFVLLVIGLFASILIIFMIYEHIFVFAFGILWFVGLLSYSATNSLTTLGVTAVISIVIIIYEVTIDKKQ